MKPSSAIKTLLPLVGFVVVAAGILVILLWGKVRTLMDEPQESSKTLQESEHRVEGESSAGNQMRVVVRSDLKRETEVFLARKHKSEEAKGYEAAALLRKFEQTLSGGAALGEVEPLIAIVLPFISSDTKWANLLDSLVSRKSPSASLYVAELLWDPSGESTPDPNGQVVTCLRTAAEAGNARAKFYYGTISMTQSILTQGMPKPMLPRTIEWLTEAEAEYSAGKDLGIPKSVTGLESPSHYLALAHHTRAVQLSSGDLGSIEGLKDKLLDPEQALALRQDHSRKADQAYLRSMRRSMCEHEKHCSMLLRMTLLLDLRVVSELVQRGQALTAEKELDDYFNGRGKDFSVQDLSTATIAGKNNDNIQSRITEVAIDHLEGILLMSPSTRGMDGKPFDPGAPLRKQLSRLRQEAEPTTTEPQAKQITSRSEDTPDHPRGVVPPRSSRSPKASETPEQQCFDSVAGYLKACSGNGRLEDFVHPRGLNSFGDLIQSASVDRRHQEYLKSSYRELSLVPLGRATVAASDRSYVVSLALRVEAVRLNSEVIDNIAFRRYTCERVGSEFRIVGEEFVEVFALAEAGISSESPKTGIVNSSDGWLAVRSEPSRDNDASVLTKLTNGTKIHYWPLTKKKYDRRYRRDIEWVVIYTPDGFCGMASMQAIDPA